MSEIEFEKIKHINEFDNEFWYARELASVLEYATFDKFKNVIAKAMVACKNSGIDENYHFSRVGKIISIGKGGQREREDYTLSRYACYLIVQNADPKKPSVALGQTYFAIQEIHQRKGLSESEKILDYMGGEELAANLFRITQTEAKIKRDNIVGADNANLVHNQMGKIVREAIEKAEGTLPENLPTPKAV